MLSTFEFFSKIVWGGSIKNAFAQTFITIHPESPPEIISKQYHYETFTSRWEGLLVLHLAESVLFSDYSVSSHTQVSYCILHIYNCFSPLTNNFLAIFKVQ
jgi:hypothetical protein